MIDEFGDCAGMPDTHRGWSVSCDLPLWPLTWGRRWIATSPDSTWDEDGWVHLGGIVKAATREELIAAIDVWILENGQ